jgi:hypothetical protein
VDALTADGVFTDNSVGISYRGGELADVVGSDSTAISTMRPRSIQIYAAGNVVLVQLASHGCPRCDVFELRRRQDQALRRQGRIGRRCSTRGCDPPGSCTYP